MAIQTLPFSVQVVTEQTQLADACKVRVAGYGHHLPQIGGKLYAPEPIDFAQETTIFIAYDKRSHEAVGTSRIQTTTYGGSTPVESHIDLPGTMRDSGRAEMTKLATLPGADPLVKLALWKAGYLYSLASQVRWLFMTARSRGLVRQYKHLGAKAFHSDERMLPLSYVSDIAHQILVLDVVAAQRISDSGSHALFDFVFTTVHPDLQLFAREPIMPQPPAIESWTYRPTVPLRSSVPPDQAGIRDRSVRNMC